MQSSSPRTGAAGPCTPHSASSASELGQLVSESRQNGAEVDRVSHEVEAFAEAAEKVIWAELVAGQRSR